MNWLRIAANTGLAGYGALVLGNALAKDSHVVDKFEKMDSDVLKEEIEDVVKKMNLDGAGKLSVYWTDRYFPQSHGSLSMPGGAYLLLPKFFDKNHLYSGKDRYGVDETVYRAMRPDGNTRKFCMAHELVHVQRGDSLMKEATFLGVSAVLVNLTAGRYSMSSPLQLARGLVIFGGIFFLATAAQSGFLHWAEFNADRKAAMLDEEFVEGGKTMCEKAIKGQKVVHKDLKYAWLLVGSDGEARLNLNAPRYGERRRRIERIGKLLTLQKANELGQSMPIANAGDKQR